MITYLFYKMLFLSLAGAVVVSLIALAGLVTRKKLSNRWNYYIWLLGVAALLIPVSFQGVSLQAAEPISPEAGAIVQTEESKPIERKERAVLPSDERKNEGVNRLETNLTDFLSETSKKTFNGIQWIKNFGALLPFLWILSVLILLAVNIIRRVSFLYSMKKLAEEPAEIQRLVLDEMMKTMGIRRNIKLCCFHGNQSPFVAGVFRSVIYIPADLKTPEELGFVLRHELTHCARWDLLYKTVIDFLTVIHFFNPAVYYMKGCVDKYCEYSCDESVVRRLDTSGRKQYGLMLLNRVKAERNRVYGSAALFEEKTELRKRVEIIMSKEQKYKWKKIFGVFLAAVLCTGGVTLAGTVNAQNKDSFPKASFSSSKVNYAGFYNQDNNADRLFGCVHLLQENGAAVTYTNFAGYTKFQAEFFAMNQDGEKLLDDETLSGEEASEVFHNPDYYTDFYQVTLEQVTRKFGDGFGLEGLFTLKKNGVAIFEKQNGYLTGLPPRTDRNPSDKTGLTVPFQQDGISVTFTMTVNLEEYDTEMIRQYRLKQRDLKRDLTSKSVLLGKILSAESNGKQLDFSQENLGLEEMAAKGQTWDNSTGEILFNTSMQNAEVNQPIGNGTYVYLQKGIQCTEDTVRGMFLVRQDGCYVDSFMGTISGLGNQAGGYAELKSDDGRYQAKWEIVPFIQKPLSVSGTRDPQEFYTEGEEVVIGTPYEQDQFDRTEHDRFYKRIVVDENGKVLLVVPVEQQQPEALNSVEDRKESFKISSSWEQLVERGVSLQMTVASGEKIKPTLVLQDPGTWWYKAVIPPENQFFIEKK